jgi:DNA-binding response OmpR family regulator
MKAVTASARSLVVDERLIHTVRGFGYVLRIPPP